MTHFFSFLPSKKKENDNMLFYSQELLLLFIFSLFLPFQTKTFFTIIPLFNSIYLFVYLFILSFKIYFPDKFRIFY